MPLCLLETFILVTVYIAILKRIENPVINQIQGIDLIATNDDIQAIFRCRKQIARIRRNSLIIFLICASLPITCVYIAARHDNIAELGPAYFASSYIFTFLGCYLWIKRRSDHNPLGNLSDLTKDDVLKAPGDYALFLRSFEKDDYTPEIIIRKRAASLPCFSEYHFTRILSQYRTVYAVGMTKEIEAPTGAKRVYLSDRDWKKDVLELMEQARFIIILLDDRPSCVWEMEQSTRMLAKTLFIVDDVEKYQSAARALVDTLRLLPLPESSSTPIALHTYDGTEFSMYPFEHNKRSYRGILKVFIENKLKQKFRGSLLKRLADNRFAQTVFTWVIIACLTMLLDASFHEQHGRLADDTALMVQFFLLAAIYYGFFTNTFRGMVSYVRKTVRWLLLIVASIACAELFAHHAGEFHILVRTTCILVFLPTFALVYHKVILRGVSKTHPSGKS